MTINKANEPRANAAAGITKSTSKIVGDKPETNLGSGEPKDEILLPPTQTDQLKSAPDESLKNQTKADKAKVIYDEMIQDPKNSRDVIAIRIKKDLGISKSAAQTYFYKFQRESGRVTEKQPSKLDKAKPIYEKMTTEGQSRKEIIAAFIKEVGLTPAGASTYFQNIKKAAAKPVKE
ncbi:MAG TPA: hypothetical protein VIF10_14400 [Methylobacter sp.]|jgi:hypothetical protein